MNDGLLRGARIAAEQALTLLFPRLRCIACGEEAPLSGGLCAECAKGVEAAPPEIPAAILYRGAGEAVLRRLKFSGERDVALWLAPAMADRLPGGEWDALVPVPLARRRRRERGYNQARALASAVWMNGGPPVLDALVRTRETAQQALLPREERVRNVAGAFAARRAVKGLRLIVVDDIHTTGATLSACMEALTRAGAARCATLCAAWTPPEGRN